MVLTTSKPIETAIIVVTTYVIIVLKPIFDKLEISLKSEIPLINAASINGIAINFRKLINMVPKGLIQSAMICGPDSKVVNPNPNAIPIAIPIKIFQCSASFFIIFFAFRFRSR